MTATALAIVVFICLTAAVLVGRWIRASVPVEHLTQDSRDTIKLAMGLVVTMTALLLGLLVGSAKGSYDSSHSTVLQIAAKLNLLDRVLTEMGPPATPARDQLRRTVSNDLVRIWSGGESRSLESRAGHEMFTAIHAVDARDDTQRALKSQAMSLVLDLAHLRAQLDAQATPSISLPLLAAVVVWLVVIFMAFSLLAPPNKITLAALVASTLSVSVAIFLILELDQPFDGLFKVPVAPITNALSRN